MAKKTVERKYDNSAIGSWAGFIYQGLCGLCYCLKLIAEDREKYKGYKLYLDSYEDFAIMDERGKLVSLHQCKNEKNVTDYTVEFAKMKTKLEILAEQDEPGCAEDCKLFFHTNKLLKVVDDIVLYPFTETQNYCEPGDLMSLINNQVSNILQKEEPTINKVFYSLMALIEQKVLSVHQKFIAKKNSIALHKIAKEKYSAISFQTIIDRIFIEEEVFAYDRESYVTRIKYKLIGDLLEISNDADDEEITDEQKMHVLFLVNHLQTMSVDEMESFLKRIHPVDNILDRNLENYGSVSSPEKVNSLYNLISELEMLDDDLSWNTDKGKETPTSLSPVYKTAKLCEKIVKNKTNNDSLYEYDWLVGDVRETVSNLAKYLPDISDVEGKDNDERSIFETKKVGLVSKQDKIDGKY